MRLNKQKVTLYEGFVQNLKEHSGKTYYIGPNEYAMIKSNDVDSDILELYIKDNKYAEEVIPKNWSESKIRGLAGKMSKQEGPRGSRDLVKEVEDEFKMKESTPNHYNEKCPKCGSNNYYEVDVEETDTGMIYKLVCKDCGYESPEDEYSYENYNESNKLKESVDLKEVFKMHMNKKKNK